MNFRAYYFSRARDAREALALAVESSVGHLNNIAYGNKPCSPLLAARIERNTDGRVMRWDLRPGDWWQIWPELEARPDAPPVPAGGSSAEPASAEGTKSREAA